MNDIYFERKHNNDIEAKIDRIIFIKKVIERQAAGQKKIKKSNYFRKK